jgi:hypothetical protein
VASFEERIYELGTTALADQERQVVRRLVFFLALALASLLLEAAGLATAAALSS